MIRSIFKNKKLLRNIYILFIILIPIWLIGIIIYYINTIISENNFDIKKAIRLYPEDVLSVQNCEQKGNRFFTLHEDPQIIILPPKYKILSTMIEFSEPITIDSSVKIYYARNNENLNEENSVFSLLPKGSSEIIIDLPPDIFTALRYDIDIFGEWYEIKGIYVSRVVVNYVLLITLIISICIITLWIFGIKTNYLDKFITQFIIMKNKLSFSAVYHFRYLIALVIFVVAVGFSLHFSSISMWDYYVPGDENQRNINLLGKGRPIRSDEWSSLSIIRLAQTKNSEFYPLINHNFGSGINMFIAGAPVFDLSLIGRPQNWGFILLGTERGFSWYWLFRIFLLFITTFEFSLYLSKNKKIYALVGAILITFSPFVQWWLNEIFVDCISYFQLTLVCLITYFKVNKSILKKVFCLFGMIIGLCGYAFCFLFLAGTLPLFIILLTIIGFILWENKKIIQKIDWIMAGCCIVFIGFIVGVSIYRSWEDIKYMLGVPSANRFLLPGSFDIRHQMYEYFSFALPFRDVSTFFNNNCEISRFVTLMPLTLILFPFLFPKMKHIKDIFNLPYLLYIILLILCIWAYIPMPNSIGTLFSKVTLLFMSTRIHFLIGLLGVYLLIVIFSFRELTLFSGSKKILLSLFAVCSILYVLYTPQVKEYLFSDNKLYNLKVRGMIIIFILSSLFLVWGKIKWCAFILSICVLVTGISVNPVARGLDTIYKKKISIEIEQLQKKEPKARWIIMTDLVHSYLPALGVNCFNTVQIIPFLDQWKAFDHDGKYYDIYNRVGFISTELTDKETFFAPTVSLDHMKMYLNITDLQLTKAKYIFTDKKLDHWNTEKPIFQEMYSDYTGYRIYEIKDLYDFSYINIDSKYSKNMPSGNHVGEILTGTIIKQKFIANYNNLCKVQILFATFARENSCSIIIQLLDENNTLLDAKSIEAAYLKDNSYYDYMFEAIPDSKDKYYSIIISSPDSEPGNSVTIWKNNSENFDGILHIGEETQSDNLCIIPRYRVDIKK